MKMFPVLLFAYYCRLLETFANSLDQDQARQNAGPWSELFNTLMVFMKEFSKKVDFEFFLEKIKRRQNCMNNYPEGKELISSANNKGANSGEELNKLHASALILILLFQFVF